jgi:hypothetical protein
MVGGDRHSRLLVPLTTRYHGKLTSLRHCWDNWFARENMTKTYSPGQAAPVSGLYELVGPRGGRTGKERTVVKGEVLPPPPKPGMTYRIAERAHNTSGRNKR